MEQNRAEQTHAVLTLQEFRIVGTCLFFPSSSANSLLHCTALHCVFCLTALVLLLYVSSGYGSRVDGPLSGAPGTSTALARPARGRPPILLLFLLRPCKRKHKHQPQPQLRAVTGRDR